ncbi:hypothetical protein EDF87_103189 [Pseudomonas helmanticensis]|uniref:Uncharacterized protein n=1 Tax=Pseudomonas helmanticensis TaxID=1471381 RepID=A0A4R7VMV5_9PSED|nr:hypothetical protein [Pseudomonas helmanticensis]TDV50557.1 hypothetical protein EDF87_103189 [Pseudomonas helmanticensis]
MVKPPKRVAGVTAPDIRPNIASTSPRQPVEIQATTPFSAGLPDAPSHQPSVQVNKMAEFHSPQVESALRSITWPADQVHLLQRLDPDRGLFTSPGGKLYANVENEGHLLVEMQHDGRYRIPFDFTPHLPGTFLIKTERQSVWTFERPNWLAHSSESDRRNIVTEDLPAEPPIYLAPDAAALLSPSRQTPDGIRYDKHRKTYIDTAEGTVMVRKNANGQYQQSSANVRDASALLFEQIPGTRLWRRKTGQTGSEPERLLQEKRKASADMPELMAGPSKRPHHGEGTDATHALTESLLSANPDAINLSFGLWRNWGHSVRPQLGQHIEIDGQYYRVMQQDLSANPQLVYLQHPLFSPALYDAFEYMLRDNPSMQPKWAVKRNNQWTVLDSVVPFEMPITQYISTTFKYLSDQSVNSLARAMFNQANRSEIIIAPGLALMNQVFRYWANRDQRRAPRRELSDPLLMLRPLSGTEETLPIPSSLGEGLMRLDFDPGRFSRHWNEYAAAPTAPNLRRLFSQLLEDDGYVVNQSKSTFAENELLFYREKIDHVFVLKLPPIIGGRLQRFQPERFERSEVVVHTASREPTPLSAYSRDKKISYLLGGTQTDVLGQTTLFIFKDR